MSLTLPVIIGIAAGGGVTVAAVVVLGVYLIIRRKRKQSLSFEDLRLSRQHQGNIECLSVRTHRPSRGLSFKDPDSPRRNRLQRSPTHRKLQQRDSRESISPLLMKERKTKKGKRPAITLVDLSDLQLARPARAQTVNPDGAGSTWELSPIQERNTSNNAPSTVHNRPQGRSDQEASNIGHYDEAGILVPRPLKTKSRSASDSMANQLRAINAQVPIKSILKKPTHSAIRSNQPGQIAGLKRTWSFQNQSAGPNPDSLLPRTPEALSALSQHPRRISSMHSFSSRADTVFDEGPCVSMPENNTSSACSNSGLRCDQSGIDSNGRVPRWARSHSNSPSIPTTASVRPALRHQNSHRASVERSSLIRDQSSSLSLSLQEYLQTPDRRRDAHIAQHGARSDGSDEAKAATNCTDVLQEQSGNRSRPISIGDTVSGRSSFLFSDTGSSLLLPGRPSSALGGRAEGHKRSGTHRISVRLSIPHAEASARIQEDGSFDTNPARNAGIVPDVLLTPVVQAKPPHYIPPSTAVFDPHIDFDGPEEMADQDDENYYSPTMSVCRQHLEDEDISPNTLKPSQTRTQDDEPSKQVQMEQQTQPWLKFSTKQIVLPPPCRETALSSSPPDRESPFKIPDFPNARPHPQGARPMNSRSQRRLQARRRTQDRSPLRNSYIPSESPEPPPRTPTDTSRPPPKMTTDDLIKSIVAMRRQDSNSSCKNSPYYNMSPSSIAGHSSRNLPTAIPRAASAMPVPVYEHIVLSAEDTNVSEHELSPTAKQIMTETRRTHQKRRWSREGSARSSGDFGAIGGERRVWEEANRSRVGKLRHSVESVPVRQKIGQVKRAAVDISPGTKRILMEETF